MLKMAGPMKYKRVTIMIPMILMIIPVLAISAILIRPLLKTMALGGVAIGIIKAQEAERVAGIMSNIGLMLMSTASDANIGRTI